MSTNRSIPAIKVKPATGTPIVETEAKRTTKEAPGTPAIPLEVIIKTTSRVNWCSQVRCKPYAWAKKRAAKDW